MIVKIKKIVALSLALHLSSFGVNAVQAEPITVFTADLPPFVIEAEGGDLGSMREILNEMALRAGIELDYKIQPWTRSQKDAQKTPNALIIPVGRNPSREPNYNWVVKTIVTNELFVSGGDPVNSLDDAKKLKSVTALAGSPRERKLNEAGLTNVNVSRNTELAAKLLTSGRADAWYTLDHRALYAIKSLGVSTDSVKLGTALSSTDLWVASSKEFDPAIAAALVKALEDMRADGAYDAIVQKYTE
ncbi:transporter substrate-binding domain-containing protein [Pacificibacter sp. AS14]|uniref:substrate-binding periplasmic protein n=1 Tax=Pacificibacter sp. AS14 TaxID=3135785 RepID=UPI0031711AAD